MADSQITSYAASPGVMLAKIDVILAEDIERGCERTTIDIHLVSSLLRFAIMHGAATVGDLKDQMDALTLEIERLRSELEAAKADIAMFIPKRGGCRKCRLKSQPSQHQGQQGQDRDFSAGRRTLSCIAACLKHIVHLELVMRECCDAIRDNDEFGALRMLEVALKEPPHGN